MMDTSMSNEQKQADKAARQAANMKLQQEQQQAKAERVRIKREAHERRNAEAMKIKAEKQAKSAAKQLANKAESGQHACREVLVAFDFDRISTMLKAQMEKFGELESFKVTNAVTGEFTARYKNQTAAKKALAKPPSDLSLKLPLAMRSADSHANTAHFSPPEGLLFDKKDDRSKACEMAVAIFSNPKLGLGRVFVYTKRNQIVLSFTESKFAEKAILLSAKSPMSLGKKPIGLLKYGMPEKQSQGKKRKNMETDAKMEV